MSTGHITEAEARSHPRRNIVTRALGIEPTVKVDTWVHGLVKGDRYVLCSDGLVDEVEDDEIAAILTANAQPQEAAEALVAAANASGGRDNVTVVVIDVLDGEDPTTATAELVLDLDRDGDYADQPHLIDAEAGTAGDDAPADGATLPSLPPRAAGPAPDRTMQLSATEASAPMPAAGPAPRRAPWGWLLFLIGLGVIVTLTVVLFLVVRHNESDPTPSTTTSTTSTTSTTVPETVPATSPATSAPVGSTSTPGSGG